MEATRKLAGGSVILAPTGRVDLANADALRSLLTEAVEQAAGGRGALILDLAGLEYISSAGLRSLMIANKAAKAQGVTFGVAAMQPLIREIFQISRFDMVFKCFDTLPDAVAALAPAAAGALDG